MSERFVGKNVLVTGGNSGLGLGTVRHFLSEGARVFVADLRQEELDKSLATFDGLAVGVQCDITRRADLRRLFGIIEEEVSELHVVVANAGAATFGTIADYTDEMLDETFGLNLKGTAFTVQGALPLMVEGGSVILVSSIEGMRGSPALGVYAATKAALQSFARTWANELKERRIRVNAISPGVVPTPAYERAGVTLASLEPLLPSIPAGRLGTTEDIARAIGFLASDESGYVNGTNLVVDGGQTEVV